MFNLSGVNIPYMKAGWINNMSNKATYEQVYHLLRLADWALLQRDKRLFLAAIQMLQGWVINEPLMARAALETWKNRERSK